LSNNARPRAVVVVTGSELVRGERTDLNGPFLAREAMRLGLEPARIAIVGDSPEELEPTLREALAEADAVLVSGGLGPTHDDRTVELVAKALEVGLHVEPELESQIEAVSRVAAVRLRRDYADFAPGVTKQATVRRSDLARARGTAPGCRAAPGGRLVVVLPGPPSAAAAVAERARDRCVPGLPRVRPPSGGAPPLRRQRVGGGAGAAAAGGDGDGWR
jgi:nicotinamide-nucleotide amidase